MSKLLGRAIASALVLVAGAAMAKPPVPISECGTVVTEAGKYRVTQDLNCGPDQQGIEVLASDVTVDLRGHTINCDASGEFLVGAVLVGDYFDPTFVLENVTVKNGTVSGCDDAVIYFFTRGGKITGITATGNPDSGITLLATSGLVVKHNNSSDNLWGIRLYWGSDNTISHNTTNNNFGNGIFLYSESDSMVACNKSAGNQFGIGLGPFSSGNKIKGNFIENSFVVGVNVWGYIEGGYYETVPWDNVIEKNLVRASGSDLNDLGEVVFDGLAGEAYIDEGLGCQNIWRKNDYVTSYGPTDCFAPPVTLDDEDVCALDDDDGHDDD
jgi:parallel beta-helix repeat protein